MKKSEMLELLKQDIKDAEGNLDLQAGMVLARVLSCGMLAPPLGVEAVTGNIVYCYYPETVETNDEGDLIPSKLWDQEDE